MNFLQLCRAVAVDSGTVAGVPSFNTVSGATGRVAQVVSWVRDAYIDIQNERPDWLFMRKEFTGTLTPNVSKYSAADLGVTDLGKWLPDLPREGWRNLTIYESGKKDQESELSQIEFKTWRERYDRGVHQANKPTEWAVSASRQLCFGNTPDKAYIVRGEYRRAPQELTMDNDVPVMPAEYHRAIVGEALRLMARSDEAFQVLQVTAQQYDRLRNPLVRDQTPDMTFGGGSFA